MKLMKRDLKTLFQDSKMVAVVQNNASNAEDMMIIRHRLHKQGITVKSFPNKVMLMFLFYCPGYFLPFKTVKTPNRLIVKFDFSKSTDFV